LFNISALEAKETFKHVTATFCFEHYKVNNSGVCWVLTIIDIYSKLTQVYLLKAKSGQEVTASYLLFSKHSTPVVLQSDNGKEFTNSFKDFCPKMGNKKEIIELHEPVTYTHGTYGDYSTALRILNSLGV
jgi:hypothetical protein